jgi:hypothetical protein
LMSSVERERIDSLSVTYRASRDPSRTSAFLAVTELRAESLSPQQLTMEVPNAK